MIVISSFAVAVLAVEYAAFSLIWLVVLVIRVYRSKSMASSFLKVPFRGTAAIIGMSLAWPFTLLVVLLVLVAKLSLEFDEEAP